jgi:predicted benzoate:H+ symporter BenE
MSFLGLGFAFWGVVIGGFAYLCSIKLNHTAPVELRRGI